VPLAQDLLAENCRVLEESGSMHELSLAKEEIAVLRKQITSMHNERAAEGDQYRQELKVSARARRQAGRQAGRHTQTHRVSPFSYASAAGCSMLHAHKRIKHSAVSLLFSVQEPQSTPCPGKRSLH
jgi:hypothetical protein